MDIRSQLPFSLLGVDSDNGAEFINKTLLNYCNDTGVTFTRGRPYRKNDNCFVEQKNDIAVRRTVGYYRFDTDAEHQALQEVYTHLCPLLNYFYASVKLVGSVLSSGVTSRLRVSVVTPPLLPPRACSPGLG